MAEEATEEAQVEDEEVVEKKKAGLMPKILTLIVGMSIGSGAGVFAVGPMVGERMALGPTGAEGEDTHAPAEDDGHGGGGGDSGGGGPSSDFHLIENLVVNPARSEGTRFLLITIAVEMEDPSNNAVLLERDMELRDGLLRSLGQHTVAELSDINARDFLTDELKVALQNVLSLKVRRILIPQFVIQ